MMNIFDINILLNEDEIIDNNFINKCVDLFYESFENDDLEFNFIPNINCFKLMYLFFKVDLINESLFESPAIEIDLLNEKLYVDESILRKLNLDLSLENLLNIYGSEDIDVELFKNYLCNSKFLGQNCIDLEFYDGNGYIYLMSIYDLNDINLLNDILENSVYYEDMSYDINNSINCNKFIQLDYKV